jgi:hypothetical protein
LSEPFDQCLDVGGAVSTVAGEPFWVGVKFPKELQQMVLARNGFEHDSPYQIWFQGGIDAGHDRADVGDRIGGARVRLAVAASGLTVAIAVPGVGDAIAIRAALLGGAVPADVSTIGGSVGQWFDVTAVRAWRSADVGGAAGLQLVDELVDHQGSRRPTGGQDGCIMEQRFGKASSFWFGLTSGAHGIQ